MPPPADSSIHRRQSSIAPEPWVSAPDQASTIAEGGAGADTTLQEASEAGLFAGKRFLLVGFGAEAEAQLSMLVTENCGKVLVGHTRVVVDYAVVPLFGCEVEATVDEVVTDTWLVKAIFTNIMASCFWLSVSGVVLIGSLGQVCESSLSHIV